MSIKVERMPCLVVTAPEWFTRPDFLAFLNGEGERQRQPPATWHRPGWQVEDWSDVFVTYDRGDGSDRDDIPDDIWAEICGLADEQDVRYALVCITPGCEEH